MAELPPSTSQQIADAAGLNERYVRKWLGAMVTGHLVDYDAIAKTYALPAEHAAFLTRVVGSDNKYCAHYSFQVKDAATLVERERDNFITTFDAIHDQAKPDVVLHNIYNALRADGVYLMQDIQAATDVSGNLEHPIGSYLYTVSCMHCMTVSLAYGGMGLGTMWGKEKALQLLEDAGFKQVEIKQLAHDFLNDYYIIRKS